MRTVFVVMNSIPLGLRDAVKQAHFMFPSSGKILPFVALAGWRNESLENSANYTRIGLTPSNKSVPLQRLYPHRKSPDSEVATMILDATNGDISEAVMMWDVLTNSSFVPSFDIVSFLINAYGKRGYFNEVTGILNWLKAREFSWLPRVYASAICCFGMAGELQLMEETLREMVSLGFPVKSVTGNAYLVYYSRHAPIREMEAAYKRMKSSRVLIEESAIRSISYAYMKRKRFYELGEFLRDVGLGRRNVGNLLWNLLLLSYAVNFKMKSLQKNFLAMVESGFQPDLTTFNIRALAFSRMHLFWDLHLSLEHMNHADVAPDLVTYGCVVDAYLDKKMGRNLDFALSRIMNKDDHPSVSTDPYVFEVLGKGDFHSSSEAFMEFSNSKSWTYMKLVGIYLKKQYRSRQIFWNY